MEICKHVKYQEVNFETPLNTEDAEKQSIKIVGYVEYLMMLRFTANV